MLISRIIRNFAVLLFIALPLEIAGWFLVPIALLFTKKNQLKLPMAFSWFDCGDMYIGRDHSTYEAVCAQGWFARYLWLAWRNPCNYFGYKYLSFQFNARSNYTIYDPKEFSVGNTIGANAGYRYIEYQQFDPMKYPKIDTYYEYLWIKKWSPTKCIRIRMGWKIKDNTNKPGDYCQWVFAIQPYIDYSGI